MLHKSAKKLLTVATAAKHLSLPYQFDRPIERVNTENGTFAKAEADYNKAIAQLVPNLEAAKELDLPGLERGGTVPYEMFTPVNVTIQTHWTWFWRRHCCRTVPTWN